MESPLQEQRICPACPSGIIAPTDLHLLCFECLGRQHAIAGLEQRPACPCCRDIPRLRRQQRADFFSGQSLFTLSPDVSDEERQEQEQDAMEEEDAVPAHTSTMPVETSPAGPACVAGPPTRGDNDDEDDDEISLSDASAVSGAFSSIKLDFPMVMASAAECVGLPLPPPLPPKPVSRLRQGFYGPAQPARPVFVAPALPDIWQCVKASWMEPRKTKAAVVGLAPFLRVQGETETVFPSVPPLEEALAALIIPHSAGWSGNRKPLPPLTQDKDTLEFFDKLFQLGAQLAAAANNLGVLGVSAATKLQRDAPPPSATEEYLGRAIGQMNNLIQGVATTAGRVMALSTVGSRHVWLGLTSLPKREREDLLAAPVSTDGLFGSLTTVTQRLKRLEEEKAQLSRHLPLAARQRAEERLPRRSATARRRERRQGKGFPAAISSAEPRPAPPAVPQQRPPRDTSAARPAGRSTSRQAPRLKRSSSWGAKPPAK